MLIVARASHHIRNIICVGAAASSESARKKEHSTLPPIVAALVIWFSPFSQEKGQLYSHGTCYGLKLK